MLSTVRRKPFADIQLVHLTNSCKFVARSDSARLAVVQTIGVFLWQLTFRNSVLDGNSRITALLVQKNLGVSNWRHNITSGTTVQYIKNTSLRQHKQSCIGIVSIGTCIARKERVNSYRHRRERLKLSLKILRSFDNSAVVQVRVFMGFNKGRGCCNQCWLLIFLPSFTSSSLLHRHLPQLTPLCSLTLVLLAQTG